MARVVITGGAGFLGSHLCDALLARGDEVVAYDNLLTGRRANIAHLAADPAFSFVEHDVVRPFTVDGPVDAVLHFASPASPKDYLAHPLETLAVGADGTRNALELATAKGARFLVASTSEVYGDPEVHPQPESYWGHVNPVGPRSCYDEAKRFAEAITFAYHRTKGTDVRVLRIFNSILGDEQVLYDDGRELRREPISALAARVGDNADLVGFEVPAFDSAGRIASSPATALVGHRPTGPCYEVTTRYGRSIRVTGDHSLFVEGPDGMPVARTVSELMVGDRIAVARRIDVTERDRPEASTVEAWMATGRSPWDLDVEHPGLGAEVWKHRHELKGFLLASGRIRGRDPNKAASNLIDRWKRYDRVPLVALQRAGIAVPEMAWVRPHTSGRASRVPATVFLTQEVLWLLGLFVAEGSWYEKAPKSAFIAISGDPELLERAAKVVDAELGLHVVWADASPQRSGQIYVHSTVLLRLLEHLGFGPGDKRIPGWILGLPKHRLGWFLEGYREGDGVHSGRKYAEQRRHEFSTVHEGLKDDLIVALARYGLVPSVGRYETTFKQKTGDRRYPFWRLTLCDVFPWCPLDWFLGVDQRLNARSTEDVVWASVKTIREVEPTPLVYDFCVPGRENFWAGSGVMAHNTFGPRMQVDDGRVVSNFLVQALRGDPITVYGDGSQTRSFCYVSDEVAGILALLDGDVVGPVNIGNPAEFTMIELAERVLQVVGGPSKLVYEPLPEDDPRQRQPDITLAREQLGWEPRVTLAEGLARTAEYFRAELGL